MMRDVTNNEDYYYAHDLLYSPVGLISKDGSVVERYEYDAYGKCTFLDNDFAALGTQKSTKDNPYLFTGQRLDYLDNGGLKLMYYKARYYDTATGRFINRDPIEYLAGTANLYEYVDGNPVNNLDPQGLQTAPPPLNPPVPPGGGGDGGGCAGKGGGGENKDAGSGSGSDSDKKKDDKKKDDEKKDDEKKDNDKKGDDQPSLLEKLINAINNMLNPANSDTVQGVNKEGGEIANEYERNYNEGVDNVMNGDADKGARQMANAQRKALGKGTKLGLKTGLRALKGGLLRGAGQGP